MTMLRTLAAAVVAVSLIAGPALAQRTAPATINSAPMSTGQPAKADAQKSTTKKHVSKVKTTKQHAAKAVQHVKHVKHVTHVTHVKHVKRVKHPAKMKMVG
jgi:hypothetical protein